MPNLLEGEGIAYHNVDEEDVEDASLVQHFQQVRTFIESARQAEDGRVLVHCMCGVSRSATLVIAYLLQSEEMSLVDAFNKTKLQRPMVAPNPTFTEELLSLEREQNEEGINTIAAVEMIGKNYKKASANATKAKSALDSLASGGRESQKCCVS